MPAGKTVLTYPKRIDAEIDRSMLEGEGITVNLLNHDSSMTELGSAFQIQLQVQPEDHERAVALIRSKHPERFGSIDRARKEEAAIGRGFRRFLVTIAATSLILFFFVPWIPSVDNRILVAFLSGFALGIPIWLIYELLRKIAKRG